MCVCMCGGFKTECIVVICGKCFSRGFIGCLEFLFYYAFATAFNIPLHPIRQISKPLVLLLLSILRVFHELFLAVYFRPVPWLCVF